MAASEHIGIVLDKLCIVTLCLRDKRNLLECENWRI